MPDRKTNSTAAPAVTGSAAEYQRFLPKVRAHMSSKLNPARIDVNIAYHNVVYGIAQVTAHEAKLVKDGVNVDLESLRELPSLILGLSYAALQAEALPLSSEAKALLTEGQNLRRALLKSADALGEAGIFNPAEVRKVQAGRGPLDTAEDCVVLADMFRKNAAAVQGKTPTTHEQVERAAIVGTKLVTLLKPKTLPRRESETSDAAKIRDAFAIEVQQRYEKLWIAGAHLFGRAVDERVPPLQSRARSPKRKPPSADTAAPPQPSSTPAAPT